MIKFYHTLLKMLPLFVNKVRSYERYELKELNDLTENYVTIVT